VSSKLQRVVAGALSRLEIENAAELAEKLCADAEVEALRMEGAKIREASEMVVQRANRNGHVPPGFLRKLAEAVGLPNPTKKAP